jgi:hypothetical protein
MVQNGKERGQEFSQETITQYWSNFFNNYVFEEYEKWLKMTEIQRKTEFIRKYIQLKLDRLIKRLQSIAPLSN